MKEMKHTPGPWVAIFPESRHFHGLSDITCYEVMTEKTRQQLQEEGHTHYRPDPHSVDNVSVVSTHFWRDMLDDEAKANARLIAAAPELLDGVEDLLEAAEWLCGGRDESTLSNDVCRALDKARAAIAKATGGAA